MGALFARSSSIVRPARMRADAGGHLDDRYFVPSQWLGSMTQAGVRVSPDLVMTLSAVWRCVSGIVGDASTAPCQIFRHRDDGGKERSRRHRLAYQLRWQPSQLQTAQQYYGMIISHQLLRGNAYVELVPGRRGFADQLIPRHPDRVRKERLPSGSIRYRLTRGNTDGSDRFLTSDEMMHMPDMLTFDGWLGASRVEYGLQSFGAMLATEKASQSFFSRGMTAAVVATHKGGELDEDELKNVHASLSLYASGAENNGGILVIEEDLTIAHLGIDPEKAQLLATRQNAVRQIANWFGYPGHKLEIDGQTQAYAAREQANLEYVVGCLRPIFINLEQTQQMHLFLEDEKEEYFSEFLMDALFRGDLKSQAEYYAKAIQFGWMNRNEVRLRSNLNPEQGLDRFLEPENMRDADPAVEARRQQQEDPKPVGRGQSAGVRATILAYGTGQRIIRKEIAEVTKLAKRHANDPDGWKAGLQAFYQDHAGFVAEELHVPLLAAREYAAEHGLVLTQQGVSAMESWEHTVASELAAWALDGDRAA